MPVKYIKPKALEALIRQHAAAKQPAADSNGQSIPELLIVDVRDADYGEGCVAGSLHCPSLTTSLWMDRLVRDTARMVHRLGATGSGRQDDGEERKGQPGSTVVINVIFHCTYSMNRGPTAAMAFFGALRAFDPLALSGVQVSILEGGWRVWRQLYLHDPQLTVPIHDYGSNPEAGQ
jgi:rhodanese-related sulfurtransferase